MNRRARVLVAVVVLAAALVTWLLLRGDGAEGVLLASGTVEATEANLGFEVPGRIERIGPAEGDEVAAQSELATLAAAELRAARESAAAQLDAQRASRSRRPRARRHGRSGCSRGVRSAGAIGTRRSPRTRSRSQRASRPSRGRRWSVPGRAPRRWRHSARRSRRPRPT